MPSLVSPVRILETFRRITPSVNVWQPHCSQTIGFVFDKISVNSILFVFTFQRYYLFWKKQKNKEDFFLLFFNHPCIHFSKILLFLFTIHLPITIVFRCFISSTYKVLCIVVIRYAVFTCSTNTHIRKFLTFSFI